MREGARSAAVHTRQPCRSPTGPIKLNRSGLPGCSDVARFGGVGMVDLVEFGVNTGSAAESLSDGLHRFPSKGQHWDAFIA